MKKMLLVFLILIISLAGCSQQITCNKPYIPVGNECCLDQNNNSICDNDETVEIPETTKRVESSKTSESVTQEYSIQDLQRDISSIMGEKVVLTEDKSFDGIQFYSYSKEEFVPISSYSGDYYLEEMELNKVLVGHILEEEISEEDFYEYVVSKKDFFYEPVDEQTEKFESEFNSSKGLNRYRHKDMEDISTKYFLNFSVNKVTAIDDITKMDLISDEKVVELSYAVMNYYDVYYKTGYRKKEKRPDFIHVIMIYCKPNLIVSLYGERYDWRVVLAGGTYEVNVLHQFERNREELLPQVQKILNMCEQKYAYGEMLAGK